MSSVFHYLFAPVHWLWRATLWLLHRIGHLLGAGWELAKSLAVIVSAVAAALAAGYARDTACTIAEAEKARLAFDRVKLSFDVYREFVKPQSTGESTQKRRPQLLCWDYLASNNIADHEFRALLTPYRPFDYVEDRHALLTTYCLDPHERAEQWEITRSTLGAKLRSSIFALDDAVLPFRQPLGDRKVFCENFGGFLTNGISLPDWGYGPLGLYLNRAIVLDAVREDNFPNLKVFTEEMAKHTNNFRRPADCKRIETTHIDPCESGMWAWARSTSTWLVSWVIIAASLVR